MKILKFSAQNVRGLKVVEIAPDGDVVTISGTNGAGKSTVLDSIEATLCGGKLALRKGEERGRVELDIGEYTVQRIITEKTDRLVIRNKDGAQYPSPREFLSKFVGPLSIDPLSFIRMKDREQLEVLFRLCPALQDGLAQTNAGLSGEILDEPVPFRIEQHDAQSTAGLPGKDELQGPRLTIRVRRALLLYVHTIESDQAVSCEVHEADPGSSTDQP